MSVQSAADLAVDVSDWSVDQTVNKSETADLAVNKSEVADLALPEGPLHRMLLPAGSGK